LCFRLLFQRADNLLAEVLGVGSHAGSLTQFSLYTQSETALELGVEAFNPFNRHRF